MAERFHRENRMMFRIPISRRGRIGAVCSIVFLLPIVSFRAAVRWWAYPADAVKPVVQSTWIEDGNSHLLGQFVGLDDGWCRPLSMAEMNPHLLRAVVAVEDTGFYNHAGVDWGAVLAAAWEDVTSLHVRRGASTITMQLHRLRVRANHSFAAKLSQTVRAEQIEKTATKQQILLEYLNRTPFGGNITGVGAASLRYFAKPCRNLSLAQAALLAGLPQNPQRLRPDRFPDRARVRRDHVLERMLATHAITPSEFQLAICEPVVISGMSGTDAWAFGLRPTLERVALGPCG